MMVFALLSCHASAPPKPPASPISYETVFPKPSPHGYGFRRPVPLGNVQPIIQDLDQLEGALKARQELLTPEADGSDR